MSYRGNCPEGVVVVVGNWQRGNCPTGVIVLWGSCPWGSCLQGSCPQGSCPRGSCPRTGNIPSKLDITKKVGNPRKV